MLPDPVWYTLISWPEGVGTGLCPFREASLITFLLTLIALLPRNLFQTSLLFVRREVSCPEVQV